MGLMSNIANSQISYVARVLLGIGTAVSLVATNIVHAQESADPLFFSNGTANYGILREVALDTIYTGKKGSYQIIDEKNPITVNTFEKTFKTPEDSLSVIIDDNDHNGKMSIGDKVSVDTPNSDVTSFFNDAATYTLDPLGFRTYLTRTELLLSSLLNRQDNSMNEDSLKESNRKLISDIALNDRNNQLERLRHIYYYRK